jgi:hypothetical protein
MDMPESPPTQPVAAGTPTASPWDLPAQPPGCQICGSVPATQITLRQGIGMMFLRKTKTARAYVCRDCGIALFRKYQAATLLTGWWGFISLFLNLGTLWSNSNERRKVAALAAPRPPAARTAQTPRTTPLPTGSPAFLRPQALGVVGVALAIALLFGFVGRDGSSTGTASVVSVGTCGSVDGGRVHYPVDCSDPAAVVRIDAILPASATDADCPAAANGASNSETNGLVCWEPA